MSAEYFRQKLNLIASLDAPDVHQAIGALKEAVSEIERLEQSVTALKSETDGVEVELAHYRSRITELEKACIIIQAERNGAVSTVEHISKIFVDAFKETAIAARQDS